MVKKSKVSKPKTRKRKPVKYEKPLALDMTFEQAVKLMIDTPPMKKKS